MNIEAKLSLLLQEKLDFFLKKKLPTSLPLLI